MTDFTERARKILAIVRNPDTLDESHIEMAAAELRAVVEEAELKAKASYEKEIHLAHRIVDGVKALNDRQIEIAREAYKDAADYVMTNGVLRKSIRELADGLRAKAKEVLG